MILSIDVSFEKEKVIGENEDYVFLSVEGKLILSIDVSFLDNKCGYFFIIDCF